MYISHDNKNIIYLLTRPKLKIDHHTSPTIGSFGNIGHDLGPTKFNEHEQAFETALVFTIHPDWVMDLVLLAQRRFYWPGEHTSLQAFWNCSGLFCMDIQTDELVGFTSFALETDKVTRAWVSHP